MKSFFYLHPTIRLRLIMSFFGVLCYSTVGGSMTIYYNKHMGAGITGILLIISSVLVFLFGLWAGHLSDLYGRRPIMLLGLVLGALGLGIATFSNSSIYFNPWLTFVGFLISSFGSGFFNTSSQAMIVDLTTTENRRVVYSIQYWIINFAILIGAGLSGWFFRDYLFWLLLAIFLDEVISFIVVFFWIKESFDPEKSEKAPETNILKAYVTVAKDKTFVYYLFSAVFISMIFSQVDYYLPVHLSNNFIPTQVFGIEIYGQRMLTLFLMINTAMIVLGMGLTNRLTSAWSRSKGMGFGITLQGTGFVLAFLGRDFTWLVIASVIATLGEMIAVPFSQSLRADLMEGDKVGTYTGAFTVTQPIASVLSGTLVSISVFIGSNGMALVMVCIILLGLLPGLKAVRMYEEKNPI